METPADIVPRVMHGGLGFVGWRKELNRRPQHVNGFNSCWIDGIGDEVSDAPGH
jgi:hypothetical protein